MTRPLIGLNTDAYDFRGTVCGIRDPYWRAVWAGGGFPVLLPPVPSVDEKRAALDRLDGFILIGGDDLPGERYGKTTLPTSTLLEPERADSDLALIDLLIAARKPTLAICLGFQELNVHQGGSLIQDLIHETDSMIRHYAKGGDAPSHDVQVEPDSLLAGAVGRSGALRVNSRHHQAVDRIGEGLRVAARAPDGIVEALELEDHPFFLGVQWHPESIIDADEQLNLFRTLVQKAVQK